MKTGIKTLVLALLTLLCLLSTASAACSFVQQVTQCNAASKAAFASAFVVAAAIPPAGCHTMTDDEWDSVGCSSPAAHKSTKICAPAAWSSVLSLFADAIALKTKILFRAPYTIAQLFQTANGRALMRHELTHIRQQDSFTAYGFGFSYITEYCNAGCSYANNIYELEATAFQNDIC